MGEAQAVQFRPGCARAHTSENLMDSEDVLGVIAWRRS
jgi:hypothetical protein